MWSPSKSLVWRLSFLILGGTGLVLAAVLIFSNMTQSRLLIRQQQELGEATTQAAVNRISELLARVETTALSASLWLEESDINSTSASHRLEMLLKAQPDISGITLAISTDIKDRPFTMLHAFREGETVSVEERNDVAGEYMQDWYYLPRYMGRAGWVEPYFDDQSKKTAVSYAIPLFDANGQLHGVASCELTLEGIREMLDALPLGESGMAILLSAEGVYISHPVRSFEMKESIFSIAEAIGKPGQPLKSLADLGHTLLSGETGMSKYQRTADDTASYIYYRPVPVTGWSLSVTIPEDQVLAPLRYQNKVNLLIGLAGALLLLGASITVAVSLTKPLHQLAAAAGHLAMGDFDAPLPKVRRGDEIGRLTSSFARMREDLHNYIEELTTTTAAKEKIASELTIAHQIQLSIVPKLFPPFPERQDLELFATLEPAREVGGDLYDFTLLDEDHLYVGIGDVSGKGVPASLLMAVGKTLLKSTIQAVRDPARAMSMVNDELSADNESCMFITAFCGILNLRTGYFTFANAGHNPPLIVAPDGSTKFINRKPGPALGAMEGVRYRNMDLTLGDDELLLLYTDGVTEAMNTRDEMFGEERLREIVSAHHGEQSKVIIQTIVEALKVHAEGTEQSDDITMLAVRGMVRDPHHAPDLPNRDPDANIELANQKAELESMVAWLESSGESLGIPAGLLMAINLALEEWFVNIVSYAFADEAKHLIQLRMWKENEQVIIQIEDDGHPFDPCAQAEPNTEAGIEHRKIGGLGIHFIRKTMSTMHYSREGHRNVLTLVKDLSETKMP